MKRPARPPTEAMIGALFGAAALELEAAAEPAAVLVPEVEEPVPDDLEAPVPVAEPAPDAAEPVPVAAAGLEATVPVAPEAAPTVCDVGKWDEMQAETQLAYLSESEVEPSPCGHFAAHSLV